MPTSAITIFGFRLSDPEAAKLCAAYDIDHERLIAAHDPSARATADEDHTWRAAALDDVARAELDAALAHAWAQITGEASPPAGRRLHLSVLGDSDEMSDLFPMEYVLGVELDSRYAPTLIDFDEPHGTDGVLDVSDRETLRRLDIAKHALETHLPALRGAHLFHKLSWY